MPLIYIFLDRFFGGSALPGQQSRHDQAGKENGDEGIEVGCGNLEAGGEVFDGDREEGRKHQEFEDE